jgi:hypothetical protein
VTAPVDGVRIGAAANAGSGLRHLDPDGIPHPFPLHPFFPSFGVPFEILPCFEPHHLHILFIFPYKVSQLR